MRRLYFSFIALLIFISLGAQNRYIEIEGESIIIEEDIEYFFEPSGVQNINLYEGKILLKSFTLPVEINVPEYNPVTGVKLNTNNLPMLVGETETLTATVLPAEATNKSVSWQSSDNETVTVDEDGKIEALKEGRAYITVTTVEGKKLAGCFVGVYDESQNFDVVMLDYGSNKSEINKIIREHLELGIGDANNLTNSVPVKLVSDFTYEKAKELSDALNNAGATAYWGNGLATEIFSVITLKNGKDIIAQAKIVSSYMNISQVSARSYFKEEPPLVIGNSWNYYQAGDLADLLQDTGANAIRWQNGKTGIYISDNNIILFENTSVQINHFIYPKDAGDKNLIWESSNTAIATVDNNGVVTGHAIGEAVITVTIEGSDQSSSCRVLVRKDEIPELELSKYELSIKENESSTIEITAGSGDYTISIDNPSVASVSLTDSEITIVGLTKGSATLTVKDNYSEWEKTVNIIVKKLSYVRFTTNKPQGEIMILDFAVAKEADKADCWIDLNNNGIRDEGEDIKSFTSSSNTSLGHYEVDAPIVTVYGEITAFVGGYNLVGGRGVGAGITSIDFSNNKGLTVVTINYCGELTNVDFSKNLALTSVRFDLCGLNSIDVTKNINLLGLTLYSCYEINNIDITNNTKLRSLNLAYTIVSQLDVSNNSELYYLRWDIRGIASYAPDAVNKVINDLPNRSRENEGSLYLKNGTEISEEEITTLANKNWELILM